MKDVPDADAARLIDTLQAFVFGELDLSDPDADAAMRSLDDLLPDLPAESCDA